MVKVQEWKKRMIWIVYIPVGLFILLSFGKTVFNTNVLDFEYFLFLLLGISVAFFPVRTRNQVFSLLSGITLATFVLYGLIPAIFLSNLAFIIILKRADVQWDQHYRYSLNLLAESILTTVSGSAYYLSENILASNALQHWASVPLVVYLLTYCFSNQLLAYLTERFIYNDETASYFNVLLLLSLLNMLVVFPLSYILVFMTDAMGYKGGLVGAIPFLTVTIGMKYYYKTTHNNEILKDMNYFVQKMSRQSTWEEVVVAFMKYTINIFPSNQIYCFSIIDGDRIQLESTLRHNEPMKLWEKETDLGTETEFLRIIREGKLVNYKKISDLHNTTFGEEEYAPESVIALPVSIFEEEKGAILITHQYQAVYDDFIISLVEVFYQYFKITLNNVYQYEVLKGSNSTDYLTKLPNLGEFSRQVESLQEREDYGEVAMIVLDLDYFKSVNDIHGHEAGNEVLVQVADVLRRFVNDKISAFRYGGEEFILLIKECSKKETYGIAENIRKTIEAEEFHIRHSIKSELPEKIHVTASLGVSNYPENAKDIQDLVKNADRAMYNGSKQKGRNMVTVYNKGS